MNNSNDTLKNLECLQQIDAVKFYTSTRKINIYITILIIVIGLVGNGLAVFVFAQKRFRIHSSSVYLLCLCLSDGLFLMMHFFEDTIRTYIDVYYQDWRNSVSYSCRYMFAEHPNVNFSLNQKSQSYMNVNLNKSLLVFINITDQFDVACRFVNYLRYFLRFISAYVIIAFTVQRTFAIYSPFFQSKFESKNLAWTIVKIVVLIGFLINIWVPFVFTRTEYCDVNNQTKDFYFTVTVAYITLTMLIPIIVIFSCNTLIMYYVLKASKEREGLTNGSTVNNRKQTVLSNGSFKPNKEDLSLMRSSSRIVSNNSTSHSHFTRSSKSESMSNIRNSRISRKSTDSNKITRMLLLMSFSYAILNLPYFISWCLFFKIGIGKDASQATKYYTFSATNLCEIFYILNYGIHFFIYCASGKKFRQLLKNAFTT